MATSTKPTFAAGAYMAEQGLTFSSVDEEGNHKFTTPEGEDVAIDVAGYLKSKGVPADKMNLEFNSADEPLDVSPVSMEDRAKMALGNTRGSIGYLKNKFEDAAFHPDNGLLVKHKGAWHKTDTDGMDPWELSKDIVEGVVGLAPSVVAATVGAAKGAATGFAIGAAAGTPAPIVGNFAGGVIGGTIGGVVGAAAGGGAAEGMRTYFGKIAGTYEATDEERMEDIGKEALLNMGGQLVSIGVKPTIAALSYAAKSISKHTTPAAKEILSNTYGVLTGAGPTSTRMLLEEPALVPKEVARVLGRAGRDSMRAIDMLKSEQIEAAAEAVALARPALVKKFGALQDDLLDSIPNDFKVDVQAIILKVQRSMESAGLGKFNDAIDNGLSPHANLLKDKGQNMNKFFRFKLFDKEAVEKSIANGGMPDSLNDDAMDALTKFNNEMNMFVRMPTKTGKEAAKAALKVKRTLSDAYYAISDKKAPTVKQALSQYSKALDNDLAGIFQQSTIKDVPAKFANMNALYSKYADDVADMKTLSEQANGMEIFVNKLISNPGANVTAKGYADRLGELIGEEGQKKLRSIMIKEGAKGHVRFIPNLSKLTTAAGGGAGALAVGTGAVAPALAGAVATQTSPRLVMKQVEYGHKMLKFLQGLPENQRVAWLRNPNAITATVQTVMQASDGEEQNIQQLLSEAGVN